MSSNLAGLPQRYLRTPEAARFVGLSIRKTRQSPRSVPYSVRSTPFLADQPSQTPIIQIFIRRPPQPAAAPLIPENKTGPNSQGMTERPGEFSNLVQQ